MGYLNFDEPLKKLYHQGTITKDGNKMSKSKGNTVAPDSFVNEYGSDTFRIYLMFMGPYDEGGDWNDKGIKGIYRFLNKIYKLIELPLSKDKDHKTEQLLHETIKVISGNLKQMKFNTSISRLMELVNHLSAFDVIEKDTKEKLLLLLAPFAPHLSEELWSRIGYNKSIFSQKWPKFDDKKIEKDEVTIIVQVNGKLRASFPYKKDSDKNEIIIFSKTLPNVFKYLDNNEIIKEIYVPNKLINFVVKL